MRCSGSIFVLLAALVIPPPAPLITMFTAYLDGAGDAAQPVARHWDGGLGVEQRHEFDLCDA